MLLLSLLHRCIQPVDLHYRRLYQHLVHFSISRFPRIILLVALQLGFKPLQRFTFVLAGPFERRFSTYALFALLWLANAQKGTTFQGCFCLYVSRWRLL